jgi:hypothetical protein
MTAYLQPRQYIPFDRMKEMYRDIFSLDMSRGILVQMIQRLAGKAGNMYETIRQGIARSPYVGAINYCNSLLMQGI